MARGLRQVVAFTRGSSTTTTTGGDATYGLLTSPPHEKSPPFRAEFEATSKCGAAASEEEIEPRGGTEPALKAPARLPEEATIAAIMQAQHGLLCDGLSQCKGALAALLDLRQVPYHCWLVLQRVCSSVPQL